MNPNLGSLPLPIHPTRSNPLSPQVTMSIETWGAQVIYLLTGQSARRSGYQGLSPALRSLRLTLGTADFFWAPFKGESASGDARRTVIHISHHAILQCGCLCQRSYSTMGEGEIDHLRTCTSYSNRQSLEPALITCTVFAICIRQN